MTSIAIAVDSGRSSGGAQLSRIACKRGGESTCIRTTCTRIVMKTIVIYSDLIDLGLLIIV